MVSALAVISEVSRVRGQEVFTVPSDAFNGQMRSIYENQDALDFGVVIGLEEKWNQFLPNAAEPGVNFDCGSEAEIETVLGLDFSPDGILYANPSKAVSHIKHAASVGVNLTTFDSKEVDKISSRSIADKFGAFPDEMVVPLLQHAHQAGLEVLGVTFHVGYKASAQLKMPRMRILNIVNDSIQEYFPNDTSLTLTAEPGRFFVETAVTMVTNAIGKRVRGNEIQYLIDDGI
ncbi:hypothetical protein P3X46_011439 [Hevea brasiliensis]|uniref:Orn/DAP/Arg decarboxylase 2 N-terminal domain-containing protein n=1 Tax=Hevea brasiliensis TaxID=3981 RepID=A0ABQ9M727_HEVBR|nr:hypothetical protein P3X46_011439 [Hevea brasiliensis]